MLANSALKASSAQDKVRSLNSNGFAPFDERTPAIIKLQY
jgi:hypothetical protein